MQWECSPNTEGNLSQAVQASNAPSILAAAVTSSESAPFCHLLGDPGLTGTEG